MGLEACVFQLIEGPSPNIRLFPPGGAPMAAPSVPHAKYSDKTMFSAALGWFRDWFEDREGDEEHLTYLSSDDARSWSRASPGEPVPRNWFRDRFGDEDGGEDASALAWDVSSSDAYNSDEDGVSLVSGLAHSLPKKPPKNGS